MQSIVKLIPACKGYIWGGTKLKAIYPQEANELERLSEAWVLSNHPVGLSTIASGIYEGYSLHDYLKTIGKEGLGTNCKTFKDFPILIKWIDAKEALSIQVHPDDTYALKNEGEYGKTEMWYILDCEENAFLYYGVKSELTKETFKRHIEEHTILDVLNKVAVHKGDVFFIEAGTIHAIGADIVICEIQQNSNVTYRVYDYDRRDAQDNLRELHIDKALEVARLSPNTVYKKKEEENVDMVDYRKEWLGSCPYFTSYKWEIKHKVNIELSKKSFLSIIVLEGTGNIKKNNQCIVINKGDSLFIPAQEGQMLIEGQCQLIVTYID